MSDELTSALVDLRSALVLSDEVEGDGSAWNQTFFAALDRVLALDDPDAVAPLLLLLDDDYELLDVLWTILHGAERFSDGPYIAGLVRAIPSLAATSPEWAHQLTGRVLNSETCRLALAEALAGAPRETRAAFRAIFIRLERESAAQFGASVRWIRTAIPT